MANDLINERGEIIGTRISVYNLLPQFLDAAVTESYLCRMYELTPEQVAAARAFIFSHLDTVLVQHLKIEARIAAGNPPEVVEQAKRTRAAIENFLEGWHFAETASQTNSESNGLRDFPTFREWFAQQELHSAEGS